MFRGCIWVPLLNDLSTADCTRFALDESFEIKEEN